MSEVSFLFTNPRHHLEMMAPVARALIARGIGCQLLSLAELRGFRTPRDLDLPTHAVIPLALRRSPGGGAGGGEAAPSSRRSLARRLVAAALVPAVRWRVGKSRVVVVPNDTAFPYDRIIPALGARVVLLQEGIRFAMPCGDSYGTGGAARICAWGEGSRDLYVSRGVPVERIAITGSPRHDLLSPAEWSARGAEMMARLRLTAPPVLYMSNPIEHQGYGTAEDKLERFRRFVAEASPLLRQRGLALLVKNHAYEDPAAFAAAARSVPEAPVIVDGQAPLFAALAVAAGAVVLTSTAGIEALLFGVPIAALELPNDAAGFEYISSGAAAPLRFGDITAGMVALLDGAAARRPAADQLVRRHLYDRGRATQNVADVIASELFGR